MEVSVVLPTHNERNNVVLLVYCIDKIMAGRACEIVVVDDGSTDGTAGALEALRPHLKIALHVFARPMKLGLGNAYKKGVAHTTGKYVVIMDADLSHDPRDIPRMLKKLAETNAGIVVGSRYRARGGVSNWPLFRRITSRGANLLARIFVGKQITDMTNSFRVYKTDVIKSGIPKVRSTGFSYQMEILHHACAKVEEVPVKFHERGDGCSKLSPTEYVQFLKWGLRIFLVRAMQGVFSGIYEEMH